MVMGTTMQGEPLLLFLLLSRDQREGLDADNNEILAAGFAAASPCSEGCWGFSIGTGAAELGHGGDGPVGRQRSLERT